MSKEVKTFMCIVFESLSIIAMCFIAYYLFKESWRLAVAGVKPTALQYLNWFGIDYIIFALVTLLAIMFGNLWRKFTKE